MTTSATSELLQRDPQVNAQVEIMLVAKHVDKTKLKPAAMQETPVPV